MSGNEDWSCDANKAVTIEFLQRGQDAPKRLTRFHPQFTYPLFGDAQTIFGYQGLNVVLRFACDDLRPNAQISWEKRFSPVGETSAVDVEAILKKWMSEGAFEKSTVFEKQIQNTSAEATFKPCGELVNSYSIGEKQFEVWRGQLTSPDVRAMLDRLQIFIPLFIEGGTYVNLDDPEWSLQRWTVYFLYERRSVPSTNPYVLLGYSTVYAYYLHLSPNSTTYAYSLPLSPEPSQETKSLKDKDFKFPATAPSTYPHRSRISQFLILPPFQHQGHGSRFYSSLVSDFLKDASCVEITVEDPNEAFDDLRDYCDLTRLRTGEAAQTFSSLHIDTDASIPRKGPLPTSSLLPKATLSELRKVSKIAPRQFDRLVEMQLLSRIPRHILKTVQRDHPILPGVGGSKASTSKEADAVAQKQYSAWRLIAKHRLYKFNRDKLAQVELPERIKHLEEVTDGVEADYLRLLSSLEDSSTASSSGARVVPEEGASSLIANGGSSAKRAFTAEDVMEDLISGTQSPAKRPKT
ncbi:MAG: histone acetyltransferase 1 [Chaenotheca gracillima]|nr:MAG: histone acetyltransferase 1 [Chaenotheca gracillima]